MVKVIESCVIKPAQNTPSGLMSLSDFDQVGAITHAPIVYFYQAPIHFDSAIVTLKDSLAKVLVTFYPLASRLNDIGEGRFEVDCNSHGADFFVAESEANIEDFGDFHPTTELRALVPQVDSKSPLHEQPLLLVQFTKLSCGGICLGLATSHIIADGPSGFHFTNEWARLARGEQLSNPPPFLDRTVVLQEKKTLLTSSLRFDHPEYSPPPLLVDRSEEMEERMKESTVVTLKLNNQEVQKLKQNANSISSEHSYSRFEAVAGHMWRCACKARQHVSHQQPRLYFPIDIRNRMEPPLPKFYFGNAMFRSAAISTSGELVSKPLSYASSKIREAIDKATDEYVRSLMRLVKNLKDVSQYRHSHSPRFTQGAFYGNPNLAINSWTRLPMYGADFGWGKEIYIGPAAVGSEGKSVIINSSQEDGSFFILLHLQVAHIDDFRKFFYEDI